MALTDQWRTSSRTQGTNCVEVRLIDGQVQVRDIKDRTGPSLTFTPNGWAALTADIRRGALNL